MLRAVNVGGRNRVPMDRLRGLATALGHRGVRTHLQSGNLVFAPRGSDPSALAGGLRAALVAEGLPDVAVLVRTARELRGLVDANPLPPPPAGGGGWHVTFLERLPAPERVLALDPGYGAPDSHLLRGREVFLRCTAGYSDSALGNSYFERRLGVAATTRNWATVVRLTEMAEEVGGAQPPETAGIT